MNANDRTILSGEDNEEWFAEQLANGLLVLPQTTLRSISSVYYCVETTAEIFDSDPKQAERKLRSEMFPDPPLPTSHSSEGSSSTTTNNKNSTTAFKVSCAACLLEEMPNGFACVSSTDREALDRVRDQARSLADGKTETTKHSDHAHFVATVPLDALMKFYHTKTRSKVQEAQEELVEHLVRQGVPARIQESDIPTIELQHHLSTLLWLMKDRHPQGLHQGGQQTNADAWYWLVLGYDDTNDKKNPRWSLDLPGGKRHLGETTLEAAIRETEEETSLKWDSQWIREEVRGKGRSNFMNLYYMLSPPLDP
jgi:NUDIX domain